MLQPQNQQYPTGQPQPGQPYPPGAAPQQASYPYPQPVQQQAAQPQQQMPPQQYSGPYSPHTPQQVPTAPQPATYGPAAQQPAYGHPVAQAPTVAHLPPDQAVNPTTKPKEEEKKPQPRPKNTTQNSLMFSEIRDNMMIMADGSFRAVVACKSINFDLMSSREREGVEFSYQNFINSLTHPVQILIRSQKVDIGPYLERLSAIRKTQDNMLLGVLMDDYIEFIEILSEEANIMDKSFYVIIPYSTVGDLSNIKDAGKGFFAKMFGSGGNQSVTKIDKLTYQKAKDEMKNRVDSVTSGLFQMGVHCTQLKSKELGELFYNYYNPDTAVREPLGNFEQNTFTYVKKGDGQAPRPGIDGGIG